MGNTWLNRNSAGSVAYRIGRYQTNERYTLERNDSWWRGPAVMQGVIVHHVPEATTQRLWLEHGDENIARHLTPTDIAALRRRQGIGIAAWPRGTIRYVCASLTMPVLQNPRVVEALKWLVDDDGIANNLLAGQVFPHQTFIPRAILGGAGQPPLCLRPGPRAPTAGGSRAPERHQPDARLGEHLPGLDCAQALQASMARGGRRLEVLPATGAQVLAKFRARNHHLFIGIWGLG
jgi:peptide/nickel transport system substrate-binding protein